MALTFEWDSHKNEANRRKHGISFQEAESVFKDPNARLIGDPDHSIDEDRFVLLGLSYRLNVLVVCHCYRKKGGVIRIISARKAIKKEEEIYEEHLK